MKLINKIIFYLFSMLCGSLFAVFLIFLWTSKYTNKLENFTEKDIVYGQTTNWQKIPIFTDVKSNKSLSFQEIKEKVVFINFWATWCKPCMEEMPSIERLQHTFKNKAIKFIIASDESIEKIRKNKGIEKINLPFYHFEPDKIPGLLFTNILPKTFILVNGELLFSHNGSEEWDNIKIINLLNKYLDNAE